MKKLRVVVSLVTAENDYQLEQASAAEQTATQLGVEVEVIFAEGDAITQSQQLLEIIQSPRASEYNGIIVEPCGGTSMTQVARAAIKSNIGWVVLNREIDGIAELRTLGNMPVFSVSSDHEEIGRIQGRQFGALLPKGGAVLYLQGPSASQVAQRRAEGVQDTRPHNVSLKVLKCANWTEAGGYQAVSSWLRVTVAQKEVLDLCAGQNDLIAVGARRALKEIVAGTSGMAFSGLRFTGVDGLPKTGQTWTQSGMLAATVIVPPNTVPALKMLVKAINEKSQPAEQTLVAPYSFPELGQLRPVGARGDADGAEDPWKF